MAEVRKFKEEATSDLQRQVREAIGETVRPFEAGSHAQRAEATDDGTSDAPSVADFDAAASFLYYPPEPGA